jgi:hypothetical protein
MASLMALQKIFKLLMQQRYKNSQANLVMEFEEKHNYNGNFDGTGNVTKKSSAMSKLTKIIKAPMKWISLSKEEHKARI